MLALAPPRGSSYANEQPRTSWTPTKLAPQVYLTKLRPADWALVSRRPHLTVEHPSSDSILLLARLTSNLLRSRASFSASCCNFRWASSILCLSSCNFFSSSTRWPLFRRLLAAFNSLRSRPFSTSFHDLRQSTVTLPTTRPRLHLPSTKSKLTGRDDDAVGGRTFRRRCR